MRLTRCFVDVPLAGAATLELPAGPSAHIAKVLRLRPGAALTLFDGRGGEYEAQILAPDGGGVRVRVGAHHALEREAPVAVTLLQCLARGERMDWIVQKATELGAAAIVPVASERCVVRLDEAGAQRRALHWQAVAVAACEQCGRNRLPQLPPALSFERACVLGSQAEARLLFEPAASATLWDALTALRAGPVSGLRLLIGPEGGLSEEEVAMAERHGFRACRLGPRILRAETAPLAALAAIQTLLGDFGERDCATN
ncbi:MAG TPA: 16S rRNA (uracil(1498)-N(3))-methyltransferase [Steroidobacteraceae bacterium]